MEGSLVQVREDGGLNSGDSTRGRAKQTDLGCILEACPMKAADGLEREKRLSHSAHFSLATSFLLLLKHSRCAVIPSSLQLLFPLPRTLFS